MRLALEANQISNQRRVLILRQHLEGQAKVIVMENIEDWDVAKKILMDTFGNAQLLWLNLYSKTKEKLYSWSTGYAEGTSKGVNCGLDGIRQMQEFLRDAELMGSTDADIKSTFQTEFHTICNLCPARLRRKLMH